jgi:hypothetical protein
MDEFIAWYCSEPRLAVNRGVVLRYRLQLEERKFHRRPSTYDSLPSGGWFTKQLMPD